MRLSNLYLAALLGACLLITSCGDDDMDLPVSGVDVETLVDEYNEQLPGMAPPKAKGFAAVGKVVDARVETGSDGEESLTFTFDHRKYQRKFTFDAKGDIDFPEKIRKAKVVYLGHQMIVADLNSDFYVHLNVPQEDEVNLLPQLPYVEGSELAVAQVGEASR